MTKKEFLEILRNSLNGVLPIDKINENIIYYDEYITQNIAVGKNENAIFNDLGDPRLIARTIIDTYKMSKSYKYSSNGQSKQYNDNYKYEDEVSNDGRESHNNYQSSNSEENRKKNYRGTQNRYSIINMAQKIIGILTIIIIVFFAITLGGLAINLFFRFGIPIIFIYFMYKMLANFFTRK